MGLGWRHALVSMSGFAVEFGWAAGEAIMIPHLLSLGISSRFAGLVYLVNPIFSFWLGIKLGTVSDKCTRCNRRLPFITILSVLAVLGLGVLVISPFVHGINVEIVLVYAAFGMMDLCHDLLLVPGRALLIDMTMAKVRRGDISESSPDSLYTIVQLLGRLVALVAVSFPVERSFPAPLSHFQVTLLLCGVVIVTCYILVSCAAKDRPHMTVGSPSSEPLGQENRMSVFLLGSDNPGESGRCADSDGAEHSGEAGQPLWTRKRVYNFSVVLLIQFVGWAGIITFTFWATTWLGLETRVPGTNMSLPLAVMAIQTVGGIFLTFFIPRVNDIFSVAWVWIVSEIILLCSIGGSAWLGAEKPVLTLVVLGTSGCFWGVHTSNAQTLSRSIVDDDEILGWIVAMINVTMTVAQIFVGALSGLAVTCPQPPHTSNFSLAFTPSGSPGIPTPSPPEPGPTYVDACDDVGRVLFFYVGFGGAVVDVFTILVDWICFNGNIFGSRCCRSEAPSGNNDPPADQQSMGMERLGIGESP